MLLLRFVFAVAVWQLSIQQLFAQSSFALAVHRKEATSSYQRLFADSSFLVLKQSLAIARQSKNKTAAAICLQQMGHISFRLGYFPQALDFHLQADRIFQAQGPLLHRAGNLNDIGRVFLFNNQPVLARQHYDEAFAIYKSLRNATGMAVTQGKIGHLYVKQHQYDSAFYFERLALNHYQRVKDTAGIASIYGELGTIYEDMKKYDSASHYFERSMQFIRHTHDTIAAIGTLNNMGDIFRKTGHYKEALRFTRKSLSLSLLTGEQFHLGSVYRDLAKTHHLLGNDDSAYYYQQAGQRYLVETYSRENGTQLAVLKTMYDVEKKNSEIGGLKATRKTAMTIFVIGLLLLAVGILVISRQRLLIRNAYLQNEQEKHNHLAQKALMELQEQTLKQQLELRSRELSTHTLHIMQNNQFLEKLQKQVEEMLKDDRRDQRKSLKQLQLQIQQNINHGQHWDEFYGIFDQVHQAFFVKLKDYCDSLTRNELRLVALLKMDLGSADIASLLGISQDSARVMRYRLKKKLNLPQGESVTLFIQSL